jgi:hypothetical protein
MAPKTPRELKEQIERERAENPPAEGKDRTAEGAEVPTPTQESFLGNLKKASKPEK